MADKFTIRNGSYLVFGPTSAPAVQRPATRSVTAAEYAKEIGTTVSVARRRLEKMGVESVLITGMTERTSPLSDRCFGPMPFRSRVYKLPLRQQS